ncbi:hypothetical protein ACFL3A_09355 [Pseudomonadota bacterium]
MKHRLRKEDGKKPALYLCDSGLLGLIGMARRKKTRPDIRSSTAVVSVAVFGGAESLFVAELGSPGRNS